MATAALPASLTPLDALISRHLTPKITFLFTKRKLLAYGNQCWAFFHKFIAFEACIKHVPSPGSSPFSAIENEEEMPDFQKESLRQGVLISVCETAKEEAGSDKTSGREAQVYRSLNPEGVSGALLLTRPARSFHTSLNVWQHNHTRAAVDEDAAESL